jgi:hypothetical protein
MTRYSIRITGTGSYLPPESFDHAQLVADLVARGVETLTNGLCRTNWYYQWRVTCLMGSAATSRPEASRARHRRRRNRKPPTSDPIIVANDAGHGVLWLPQPATVGKWLLGFDMRSGL